MSGDSRLSTFIATDGENVVVQDWSLPSGEPVRGVVIIVHGLGEHAGRYRNVATRLNELGFFVRGYDQCGHGQSNGTAGILPSESRLLEDLADMVDDLRARMEAGLPMILLGHSMGGLLAARFVSIQMRPVEALVLSSPALDPGLTGIQKLLLQVLLRFSPNLRVSNGVKPDYISHDAEVVKAYREDPLVHDRISARLAQYIVDTGRLTMAAASHWTLPTLLLYAGEDHLVNPEGSRRFAQAAPPEVVTAHCFDHMYHEIFNEPDSAQVFEVLKAWLEERY
jgi:alpha-beta hydrolase superfamily lysophospholipase